MLTLGRVCVSVREMYEGGAGPVLILASGDSRFARLCANVTPRRRNGNRIVLARDHIDMNTTSVAEFIAWGTSAGVVAANWKFA